MAAVAFPTDVNANDYQTVKTNQITKNNRNSQTFVNLLKFLVVVFSGLVCTAGVASHARTTSDI